MTDDKRNETNIDPASFAMRRDGERIAASIDRRMLAHTDQQQASTADRRSDSELRRLAITQLDDDIKARRAIIIKRRWNEREVYEFDDVTGAWYVTATARDSGGGVALASGLTARAAAILHGQRSQNK